MFISTRGTLNRSNRLTNKIEAISTVIRQQDSQNPIMQALKVEFSNCMVSLRLFLIDAIDNCNREQFRTSKHGIDPRIMFFIPQKATGDSNVLPFDLANSHTADNLETPISQQLDSLADRMRE